MANRYAVKSGNWSDPTVWDGGTLPGVDDVVRPNSFTVTIDQDITVTELRNNASSPAVAGGSFQVIDLAVPRTISAGYMLGQNPECLKVLASTGTLTIIGNLDVVSNNNTLLLQGASDVLIIGNISVSTRTTNSTTVLVNAFSGSLTVDGSIFGGMALGVSGCIYGAGAFSLTTLGDIRNGGGNPAVNLSNVGAIVDLQGPLYAGPGHAAVYLVGLTNVRVKGPLYNAPNGRMALVASSFVLHEGAQTFWQLTDDSDPINGQPVLLANYTENSPAPENVREGTAYGPASSLLGTMYIPAATDVANGVLVDDTVGTAVASPSDVWDHTIAEGGIQAATRLLQTATPAVLAAQLAAAVNDG